MIKNSHEKKHYAKRKEIPIFLATDDNYIPFLAVTLQSMIENASKKYDYKNLRNAYFQRCGGFCVIRFRGTAKLHLLTSASHS